MNLLAKTRSVAEAITVLYQVNPIVLWACQWGICCRDVDFKHESYIVGTYAISRDRDDRNVFPTCERVWKDKS